MTLGFITNVLAQESLTTRPPTSISVPIKNLLSNKPISFSLPKNLISIQPSLSVINIEYVAVPLPKKTCFFKL